MLISSGDNGSNRSRKPVGLITQRMDVAESNRSPSGVGPGKRAERMYFRSILVAQAAFVSLVAALVWLAAGVDGALSLLFGATLMAVNGLWLYRGIEKATRRESGQQLLYRSAIFRFVFLLLALGLALAAGLYLPWVAAGMLSAQAVVYLYGLVSAWRFRSN